MVLLDAFASISQYQGTFCCHTDLKFRFLVACYATQRPAMSVGRSPFYCFSVFELFEHTATARWLSDLLRHCFCPPTRDYLCFCKMHINFVTQPQSNNNKILSVYAKGNIHVFVFFDTWLPCIRRQESVRRQKFRSILFLMLIVWIPSPTRINIHTFRYWLFLVFIRHQVSTRPDTRPIPVADGWAGAEMRVFTLSNSTTTDRPTNQPTNRPTDGRTDGQSLL